MSTSVTMSGRSIFSIPVLAPSACYDPKEVEWGNLAALTRLRSVQKALESTFAPLQPSSRSADIAEGRGWEIVSGGDDNGAVRVWNDHTFGSLVKSPRPNPRGPRWPESWFDGRMEAAATVGYEEEARLETGPEDEAEARARAVFTTPPSGRSSMPSDWSGPSSIKSTPSSRPYYNSQRVDSTPTGFFVEKFLRQTQVGVFESTEEPMPSGEKPEYFHAGVFTVEDVDEALVDKRQPHPGPRLGVLPRSQVDPRHHDFLDYLQQTGREDMATWFETEFGAKNHLIHPTWTTTPQGPPPLDHWALINDLPSLTSGSGDSSTRRLSNGDMTAAISDAQEEVQSTFLETGEQSQDFVPVRLSPKFNIDGSVPPVDSKQLPPLGSLLLTPFLLQDEAQKLPRLALSHYRLEECASMPNIRSQWATDSIFGVIGQRLGADEVKPLPKGADKLDEAREAGTKEPKLKSILTKKRPAKGKIPSIAEQSSTPPQPRPEARDTSTQTESKARSATTRTGTTKSTGTVREKYASTSLTSLGPELAERTFVNSPQVTDLFLALSGERMMCYNLYGDQDGMPVIFLHGMSQSRLTGADLHEDCRRMKVRLICPDRPGYGRSSPLTRDIKAAEKVQQCVDDLASLAVHLQLEKFAILGDSAGAIIALAAASKFEAAVERLQTAANPAKPILTGLSLMSCPSPKELGTKGHKFLERLAWNGVGAAGKIGQKALRKVFGKESREKLRLSPAQLDRGYGLNPEDYSENLAVGMAEMRRREPWVQGEDGMFADVEMMLARGKQAWGFDVGAIDFEPKRRGSSIQFWHGRDDKICLSTRTSKLCALIGGAEFHELPGLDHQTVLLKGGRILEGLLNQL